MRTIIFLILVGLLAAHNSKGESQLPQQKKEFSFSYYDIRQDILEKAPWGTPYNLELLRCVFPDRKFVILVRPILECLASFVKAKTDKSDIDSFCDALMNPDSGILGKNIWSINNLIDEEEQHIVSLTEQFSFGDMQYDDQHVEGPFHSIRLDKVGKINYKVEDYLPRRIIERYENISIRTTGIR